MKNTEDLLMSIIQYHSAPYHNSPFSNFSTAIQQQDAQFFSNRVDDSDVGFQQILKHVNQLIMEKSQVQEQKIQQKCLFIQILLKFFGTIMAFHIWFTKNPSSLKEINNIIEIRGQNSINDEQLSKKFIKFEESVLQDLTENKLKLLQKENQQNLLKFKDDSQLRIPPQINLSEDKTIKDIYQKIKDLQQFFDSQLNQFTQIDQNTK